jgi:hypothetical protein
MRIARKMLKTDLGGQRSLSLVGCTVQRLAEHLESQFLPGMDWSNIPLWDIDHIRPLKSFDLSDAGQRTIACHFSNLQPLWRKDNLRKGVRLDWQKAA